MDGDPQKARYGGVGKAVKHCWIRMDTPKIRGITGRMKLTPRRSGLLARQQATWRRRKVEEAALSSWNRVIRWIRQVPALPCARRVRGVGDAACCAQCPWAVRLPGSENRAIGLPSVHPDRSGQCWRRTEVPSQNCTTSLTGSYNSCLRYRRVPPSREPCRH